MHDGEWTRGFGFFGMSESHGKIGASRAFSLAFSFAKLSVLFNTTHGPHLVFGVSPLFVSFL